MRVYAYVDGRTRNAADELSVYIKVSNGRKWQFMVNSGMTTLVKFEGREFPKCDKNARVKTSVLNKKLLEVEEICLKNESVSRSELKALVMAAVSGRRPKERLLCDYVLEFGARKRAEGTRKLYELTAKKVMEFDRHATIDSISVDWLQRFEEAYLPTMTVNGLGIIMRNLRAVQNWCIDEGKTENYPFRRFKIRQERVAIRDISIGQLVALRDWPCEPWQEIYRDLFMLSFYLCGVNAVDLLECKKLKNGRFVYHRRKTGKLYDLPVVPEARAIIDKYKGKDWLLCPLDTNKDYHTFLKHWNTEDMVVEDSVAYAPLTEAETMAFNPCVASLEIKWLDPDDNIFHSDVVRIRISGRNDKTQISQAQQTAEDDDEG